MNNFLGDEAILVGSSRRRATDRTSLLHERVGGTLRVQRRAHRKLTLYIFVFVISQTAFFALKWLNRITY